MSRPPRVPRSDLNERQQAYVQHFLTCKNRTEAARRAGYAKPEACGTRLYQNPKIFAAITAGMARVADEVQVDQRYVLQKLIEQIDYNSDPTGDHGYRPSVVLKALELLGRHLAMFTDRAEVTMTGDVDIVSRLTAARDAMARYKREHDKEIH